MRKQIILGGQTYLISENPELQALVSEIASDERSKLNTKIEDLKAKLATLSSVQISDGTNPDELASVVRNQVKEVVAQEVQGAISTLAAKLDAVHQHTSSAAQASVDVYKAKLLEENKGNCVPELITGNTIEELDAAMVKSKEIFAKYAQPVTVPPATPTTATTPAQAAAASPHIPVVPSATATPDAPATPPSAPAPPPAVPNIPNIQPGMVPREAVGKLGGVKGMTPAEFRENRDKLLQEAAALLQNS